MTQSLSPRKWFRPWRSWECAEFWATYACQVNSLWTGRPDKNFCQNAIHRDTDWNVRTSQRIRLGVGLPTSRLVFLEGHNSRQGNCVRMGLSEVSSAMPPGPGVAWGFCWWKNPAMSSEAVRDAPEWGLAGSGCWESQPAAWGERTVYVVDETFIFRLG